ncbi:MAG: hypothetical protein MJE63_05270 [Proteobacteria bacterium]|nr:hypothetical protein [Pseudomonadota bacterium]
MPLPKTAKRGLENIKTNMNRVDRIRKPYMAYLRIGALEMEKMRRLKERKNIQERMELIDHRCLEIEREKAMLQQLVTNCADAPLDFAHLTKERADELMEQQTEERPKEPESPQIKQQPRNETSSPRTAQKGFRIKY